MSATVIVVGLMRHFFKFSLELHIIFGLDALPVLEFGRQDVPQLTHLLGSGALLEAAEGVVVALVALGLWRHWLSAPENRKELCDNVDVALCARVEHDRREVPVERR